mmetsp:Transcript_135657/g.234749  ORF Transcript_135657/g.234749 Transcript_135657/m.234749 type:complete len:222 (-) Transcript_135657:122-787(-)
MVYENLAYFSMTFQRSVMQHCEAHAVLRVLRRELRRIQDGPAGLHAAALVGREVQGRALVFVCEVGRHEDWIFQNGLADLGVAVVGGVVQSCGATSVLHVRVFKSDAGLELLHHREVPCACCAVQRGAALEVYSIVCFEATMLQQQPHDSIMTMAASVMKSAATSIVLNIGCVEPCILQQDLAHLQMAIPGSQMQRCVTKVVPCILRVKCGTLQQHTANHL